MKNPKICIVYDRLNTRHGGAEFVLRELAMTFPEAAIVTSVLDNKEVTWIGQRKVITSFLQNLPFAKKHHQFFLPLMPLAFETLDLSSFDVVISVTSAEALGVLTTPSQLHITYLLSPPRYLESNRKEYLRSYPLLRLPLVYQVARLFLRYVSWWYKAASKRPDIVVPLSKVVAMRAGDDYFELLEPLYPPLSMPNPELLASAKPLPISEFLLVLSRLVWYKRVDLAIDAAKELNQKLIIAGEGAVFYSLVGQAGGKGIVRRKGESLDDFCDRASDERKLILFTRSVTEIEKTRLLKYTAATCMLGREDFGLVAFESLAHGSPCIIYRESGAAEIIKDGLHGCVIKNQLTQDVVTAVRSVNNSTFSSVELKRMLDAHRPSLFRKQVKKLVYDGCL